MTEELRDIPFVAIGNDELGDPLGKTVTCAICGEQHPVEDGRPPGILQFYQCGNTAYLCGIKGRKV